MRVIGELGWGRVRERVPCSAFKDLGLLRCREAGEWGRGGGRVWSGAKDGQLGKNCKGFWAGDFCCQSFGQFRPPYFTLSIKPQDFSVFHWFPSPHQPGPGLVVTCSFKNSSWEENDFQGSPRCRMLSPGPARARTRLRASDSATEAAAPGSRASYRRPVPGWGGGQGGARRGGSSCRPSLFPRRYSQRKLGESGRLALGFVFPADSAFLRPPRPLPHRSAQVRAGPAIA